MARTDKAKKIKTRLKWFTKRRIIVIAVVTFALLAYLHYNEVSKMFAGPTVTVAPVIKKTVPLYLDYVGNTAARRTMEIRARVEGFLIERNFVEGDDVNENDLMYVIDPKPYEAALADARGQLGRDEASLAFATEQVERYKGLADKDYVSKENYDNLTTSQKEAVARVESSKAAVVQAELNLGYCRMYAPYASRVGRTLVDLGNLVGKGEPTKLATLVELDPLYVYFGPNDQDSYKIMNQLAKNELEVELTMSDGSKFPHRGLLKFVDNEVNNTTSTLTMRATMPNPEKMLLPGTYVNVRLFLGEARDALLVPEKALGNDQVGQYVMIADSSGVVKRSNVKTGAAYDDMRVITEGVKEGESVIIGGLQLVKPGMPVTAESVETPITGNTMRDLIKKAVFD